MKRVASLAVVPLATLVVAGCGGSSDSSDGGGGSSGGSGAKGTISLVAYSTPQVVYDQIIPAFTRTAAGKGYKFESSYGPSGDQSRAVAAGQKADVVAFSLSPDVDKLVKAELVDQGWDTQPHDGLVSTSVVTFVVRKGNPKHIRDWSDLLRKGVKVITPNPFSSGSAKWNLMAAYGGGRGLPYVRKLLTQNVTDQPKSGRDALQAFTGGEGDVLISYENEALTAQKKGQDVDYVTPSSTIKIENPIAVTKSASAGAKAFVSYALSKPGQEVFASWGYRPVDPSVLQANASKFPVPSGLFTIRDEGGWSKVNDTLFDPDKGAIAKVEQAAGVSTDK